MFRLFKKKRKQMSDFTFGCIIDIGTVTFPEPYSVFKSDMKLVLSYDGIRIFVQDMHHQKIVVRDRTLVDEAKNHAEKVYDEVKAYEEDKDRDLWDKERDLWKKAEALKKKMRSQRKRK